MKIGLDIGSTTIKCVVLNDNDEILHKSYERHYSQITEKIRDILQYVRDNVVKGKIARLAISGSAGMGVAENCRLPFVQEVFATRVAANRLLRRERARRGEAAGLKVYLPPVALCTDNAAMIGSAAFYRLMRGEVAALDLNALPSLRMFA